MSDFRNHVAELRAVTLDELNDAASLQTRVDRKYLVDADVVAELITEFRGAVLEIDQQRHFGYETTYFDTDDFDLYLDAARKRPQRFKARVRRYVDSGLVMLEVKMKTRRGKTEKLRRRFDGDDVDVEMCDFVREILGDHAAEGLRPTLVTRFTRTTLLGTDGQSRFTIDHDLRAERPDGASVEQAAVVIESKTVGAASSVDRWLWSHGVRPAKISKYCTMLAALEPELPSNRWHRTLRRHFADVRPALVASAS